MSRRTQQLLLVACLYILYVIGKVNDSELLVNIGVFGLLACAAAPWSWSRQQS
jgi:hypothetical protein